jgi:hypothetical protein
LDFTAIHMLDHPTTYIVNYLATHTLCGHETRRSDHRVKFREDLGFIRHPLPVHCDRCHDEMVATHIEILQSVKLGVEWMVEKTELKGFDAASVFELSPNDSKR